MDGHRQQYIPGPPSMAQSSQPHMMNLPPPPPRHPPTQSQGMMPPPPPGPPPVTGYGAPSKIPPQMQHQNNLGWQQNWGRQAMGQGFPPPPPPPLMSSSTQPQNQHMIYGRQPAPLSIPPPPFSNEGHHPLTSATYIPVGDSFGPGVGIPPLFDSHSRPTYDAYGNHISNHRVPSNQLYEHHPSDGTYKRDGSIPPTPSGRNLAPSLALHDNVRELISPGPPTATVQNPQPQNAAQSTDIAKSPSHRYNDSSTSLGGLSPSEAAVRWQLDRVVLWLARNGFSRDWQETFKDLEIQGADFLELGHGSGGRGNLGKMHQVVYPQLAKECQKSGTGWDAARERDEGKRMRKLIRQIHDDGSHDISAPFHKRRDSHPSVAIPPPEGDGGPEASPKLGSDPVFAAPKSATSEHSPGFKAFQPGHSKKQSTQMRSVTLPVPPSHDSASLEPNANEPAFWPRSDYSKAALSGVRSDHKRQSPSASSENGLFSGLPGRYFEGSPKSGSPATQQAALAPAGELGVKYEHSRGNSTDSLTGAGRGSTPTTRYYEARRQGQDGVHPSPQEFYTRQPSGENSSSYPKEHSKGFLHFFKKRPRPGESTHPSPDDQYIESPTSPVNLRQNIPYLPYTKPQYNSSDMSLERPSSSSMSDQERLAMRTKPAQKGKKWMLVTTDGWNYRLVDVTDLESVETLRSTICQNLGVSDWSAAQIFLTEPGQNDHEEPLNDTMLWLCRRTKSDSVGTLKLFVRGSHTHPGANNSTGLGVSVSVSEKPIASPTTAQHQVHRKPLDEDALSRISPHTQLRPTSPSFPSRQQALGAAAAKPSTRDAFVNTSPADGGADPGQLLEPQKSDLLARQEEHMREVERKQRAYRISKVPPASQPRKDAAYGETGYRREGIIDFDSPRISPYEDKKADTLVPLRKPPTAPNGSNTLTRLNSISQRNVDRPSVSPPVQTHGLGAALASVGRMTSSIGTPSPSVPVHSTESANQQAHADGNAATRTTPDEPRSASQFASGENDENTTGPYPGQSPDKDEEPQRPTMQSRKSYGPEFDFEEAKVSFERPPNLQEDSDDSSDDGLFAVPLAAKANKDKGAEPGARRSQKKAAKPSLTVNTESRLRKGLSVSFKSPNAGETFADSGAMNAKGPFPGAAESPEDERSPPRRDSFARGDIWASRPPVEGVIDNLDDFFPNIDLDAPYLQGQTSSPPTSPASKMPAGSEANPKDSQALPYNAPPDQSTSDTLGSDESTLKASGASMLARRNVNRSGGGLQRMKSIREVAKGAHQTTRNKSVSSANNPRSGDILRRKSTKMFGARIMQISPKPGSRLSQLDPIPQHHQPQGNVPQRQPTFRIVRGQLIGKGTYGRVYLGINADNGEVLAVKQVEINSRVAGQDRDRIKEMVAAMDQEIDTMQHLEHPNIVQYLGCERGEYSISIYLEYISGGSIGSCLRKHGKFEESVVKSLTHQTLSGLAYLHDRGILHRDMKADNILLDLDGTCKISDFGISKKSDNIYGNDSTNSMQGSVFWMAPEVIQSQGQGYSAKVDIWSLGCVVLEMFAGRRPWSREEAIGAIFKLGSLNQAPPIPDDVSMNITPAALAFMYDCFTVDASDRPTAGTLLTQHPFCEPDPKYNFLDTELYAKIRHVL